MSEAPIRMTLVRHGQSEANLVQRWQGQGDSPLSALGKEQASRLGQRLARRRYTHVVSSDLQRARDTALATASDAAISGDEDAVAREIEGLAGIGVTDLTAVLFAVDGDPDAPARTQALLAALALGGSGTRGEVSR